MTDAEWMDRALAAARGVRGVTTPNPAVGAVVVRDGRVLGVGATSPVGGPHAEANALTATRSAGHDPAGATMYVTLEPCCHFGRTAPCTHAVIDAGIRRVVVGTLDPFPAVQGKGLRALQAAGVEVTLGVREGPCAAQIRGFARATRHGLPEVGVLARAEVTGSRIVQPDAPSLEDDAAAVDLRRTWDAVVVDASRTALPHPGARRLVVLDRDGDATGPLLDDPRLRLVLRAERAPDGPLVEHLPAGADGLATESVLRAIVRAGLHRVLFEVTPPRQATLLAAGVVDTVVVQGPRPPDRDLEWPACTAHLRRPETLWLSARPRGTAPPG